MIEKMTAKASKYGLEIYWFIQYKRLKRTKNTKIRRLEKEKEEIIQQLASARFEEEIAKTREKLARKQIRQLKEVIKDLKKDEKEKQKLNNTINEIKNVVEKYGENAKKELNCVVYNGKEYRISSSDFSEGANLILEIIKDQKEAENEGNSNNKK